MNDLFMYRQFTSYFWNPASDDSVPSDYCDYEYTIDECLKSRPVHDRLLEKCKKHGYKLGITKDIIRAFFNAGKGGHSVAGQKRIAEVTGWCLTTVQKYYRFLVQIGELYSVHRTRKTKHGDRRTTNITVISVFIEYAKRRLGATKSNENKGSSLIPPNEGRIILNTTQVEKSHDYALKTQPKIESPPNDSWMDEYSGCLA